MSAFIVKSKMFHRKNASSLFVISVVGAISLMFSHCHSKDLGGEAPDRVQINPELAGWDQGAGDVIQQKCANCHRGDRAQTVPGNTPHSLDSVGNPAFFTEAKNSGLIKAMKKRIELTEGDKIMPPRFATPLYAEERGAVLAFLDTTLRNFDAIPKPTPTPTPTPSEGPTPTPAPTKKWVFDVDIKPIALASCAKAGCHTGGADDQFSLQTRQDFVDWMPTVLDQVKKGDMPLDDITFVDSEAGKKMIGWLSGNLEE